MNIILHRHCRELGYCNLGLREWFSREGLDWPAFVKHEIASEVICLRDNAMAERASALAERESHGQQ